MLVGRGAFERVVTELGGQHRLAVDTETTGLRPYHGDKLFSLIIRGERSLEPHYFNFYPYPGLDPEFVLTAQHLQQLKVLFSDPSKLWYIHRFNFDMHILSQEGIEIAGTVHCTQSIARVEYNDHPPGSYDLASCAERIGLKKDDAVEKYIADQGLWEKLRVPGKNKEVKNKFYSKVPLDIIVPYGCTDADVGFRVGEHQTKTLEQLAHDPAHLPPVSNILRNERRLAHTIFRMERVGVRIDRPYCVRAAQFEADRAEKAIEKFKAETGRDFKASGKLFAEVFADEKDKWVYTEKGNPSFEADVVKTFESPAAKAITEYRDAKSKADFYNGFLYHADDRDVLHPNFNPGGAASGRFSSAEPNFQNLTSEEDEEELKQEFVVRRAIIPRPGFVFFTPDYDQMEYRMMFDYACSIAGRQLELVRKMIEEKLDPHQATADVVTAGGTPLTRKRAKNGNFAILYGSGDATLSKTIGSSIEEATALRQAIFKATPEINTFVRVVINTARSRGVTVNWAGRRSYWPDRNFAYKAPNYLIQGGCADVAKMAMNHIDEYLLTCKSRMVATIHDEFPIEVHESELANVPRNIINLMESVYPYKFLRLTAGAEWSDKSLADKKKGYPV